MKNEKVALDRLRVRQNVFLVSLICFYQNYAQQQNTTQFSYCSVARRAVTRTSELKTENSYYTLVAKHGILGPALNLLTIDNDTVF